MLRNFIIANLLLLAIAATIENNETTNADLEDYYDESEWEVKEGNYSKMVEPTYASTTENLTEEWTTEDIDVTTTERPICQSNEWQCADLSCVRQEYKCDGAFHCEDGSDETRANCNGTQRPMLGLLMHCMADRAYAKAGVCPDICRAQPEYCAYALLAEQENAPLDVCVLPDFIRNRTYKITKLNSTSDYYINRDFVLNFECAIGTELVGEANPECVNGTWNADFPYCSDTCKLKKKSQYTYTCKRGDKSKPCGDFVAIGTEVVVEKLDKKISNSSISTHTKCTEERAFDVSSACVEEVEIRQDRYEKDILNKLSEFETKFKETKQPSFAFEELVRNYREFERHVSGNSTELSVDIAVCDIKLDFMDTSS